MKRKKNSSARYLELQKISQAVRAQYTSGASEKSLLASFKIMSRELAAILKGKYILQRKKNPSRVSHGAERLEFIKRGAKLYEDFSGHEAEIVAKTKKPKIPDVLVAVGVVDYIAYTTVRDGQEEKYIHRFKRSAAPRFCVSPDGRQIFFIDGSYDFTEHGLVDRV